MPETNPLDPPEDLLTPQEAPKRASALERSRTIDLPRGPTISPLSEVVAAKPIPQPEEEIGFWEGLADLTIAPARGIANFGIDFYGLVDYVGGFAGLDLPDIERLESKTWVGGLLSDLVQLTAGAAAGGAILSGVGIAGKLGQLGKAGKFATFIADNFVGDALFYHQDKNIARVLKDASLGSPLTDWLATDDDDGEISKRLLGAIDGLGANALTSALFGGMKVYRAGKRQQTWLSGAVRGDPAMMAKLSEEIQKGQVKTLETLNETFKQANKNAKTASRYNKAAKTENELVDATITALGVPGRELRDFIHTAKPMSGAYATVSKAGTPFDRAVAALTAGARRGILDPIASPSAAAGFRAYESIVREAAEATIRSGKDLNIKPIEAAYGHFKDWLRLSQGQEATWLARMDQQVGSKDMLVESATKIITAEKIMEAVHADLKKQLNKVGITKLTAEEAATLIKQTEKAGDYVREILGFTPHRSRRLSDIADEVTSLQYGGGVDEIANPQNLSQKILVGTPGFRVPEADLVAAQKLIIEKGGSQKVLNNLIALKNTIDQNELSGLLNTAVYHKTRAWDMISEWWINGILSHGQTQIVNLASNFLTSLYRPMETVAGGLGRTIGGIFDQKLLTSGMKEVKHGLRIYSELTGTFLDTIGLLGGSRGGATIRKAVVDAFQTGESTLLRGAADAGGKLELSPAISAVNLANVDILGIGAVLNKLTGVSDRSLITMAGAQAIDKAGHYVRLPQRLLSATDELFKQVNFRAKAKALLLDEAEAAGIPLAARGAYVATRFDNIIKDGNALSIGRLRRDAIARTAEQNPGAFSPFYNKDKASALNDSLNRGTTGQGFDLDDWRISQKSLGYAKEVTFTEDSDKFTQAIKTAQIYVPFVRLIMPFITTPVNLLKFAFRRSVDPILGLAGTTVNKAYHLGNFYGSRISQLGTPGMQKTWTKFSTDLASNDPIAKADAIGRLFFATGTISTAIALANNGLDPDATLAIHGQGPRDNTERRLMQEAKVFFPYSIRIGKIGDPNTKFIQFSRLDPIGSILGITADLWTFSHFAPPKDQSALETMIGATISVIGNNLVNKTYLSGLADFLEYIQSDPTSDRIFSGLKNFGASFMIPNALNSPAFGGEEENTMREIHSFLDARMNRTPWGADKLQPIRNQLGEPVKRVPQWGENALGRWMAFWSPFKQQTGAPDPILKELADLRHPFKSTADDLKIGGIDIDLYGYKNAKGQTAEDRFAEIVGEGGLLRQSLKQEFESDSYKALPSYPKEDPIDNLKVQRIGAIFAQHRQAARIKLIEEFPDILKFIQFQVDRRTDDLNK